MENVKQCSKCHKEKTLSEFYRTKKSKTDGVWASCKECNNKYRATRKEQNLQAQRKWIENNKKYFNEYQRNYQKTKFPEKNRARNLLFYAVNRGEIQKLPCNVCGVERVEGHHEDYSKPLEVIWLCPRHHKLLHKQKKLCKK